MKLNIYSSNEWVICFYLFYNDFWCIHILVNIKTQGYDGETWQIN